MSQKVLKPTAGLAADLRRSVAHADVWPQRLPGPGRNPVGKRQADPVSAGKKLATVPSASLTWSKPRYKNHRRKGVKMKPLAMGRRGGGSSGKQAQSAAPWRFGPPRTPLGTSQATRLHSLFHKPF